MDAFSLFSGIGGFDLAFERAHIDVVGQAEIEPSCQAVLAKYWPKVERYTDVKDVPKVKADLICGGFPCQDISVAGKRAGLSGDRSGLWYEFARILDESRPEWCLIENVPGLLSSNDGRDMGAVLGTLSDLGYGFAYRVLDAQHFGVPQRRRRVFIVGCLGDARSAGQVLLERPRGDGDPGPSDTPGATSAGTVGSGTSPTGRDLLADTGVVSALSARMGTAGHGDVANAQAGSLIPYRKAQSAHHPDDCERWEEAEYTNTLDAEGNVTRTSHAIAYSVYPKTGQGSELGARETDIATTLSATDGSLHERGTRIATETDVRRLMPVECTRLQGFPDSWLECESADAEEARSVEVLRSLWREAHAETRGGRRPGVALALLSPEILLAGVHGGWLSWEMASECADAAGALQGADAWPESFVCGLRDYRRTRPSPYRRESFEQLARELGRPLSQLPLTETQAAATLRSSGVWAEAQGARSLHSAPAAIQSTRSGLVIPDTHKYRMLGNAVAVPVVEWIARRLVEVAG